MQDRSPASTAVVDFDFDDSGKIVKSKAQPAKAGTRAKTLEEIRQRVLSMAPRQPQRHWPWSRSA
jgi:hypothetical protein